MKIFFTGATGVIGWRAIPLIIGAGHQVSAVGRTAPKRAWLERIGAAALNVDLFDVNALREAMTGHDVVVNMATHIPVGWHIFFPGAWHENDRIRRLASASLVEAARAAGIRRFIQESFAPIYPDSGDRWVDENTPLEPIRYNRSVLDAEASAIRFMRDGADSIILRFAWFYGVDAVQTIAFIKYVRQGWAPIPGLADSFISSVSHDDAATAVLAALTMPPGVYNVSDDEPLHHREYFDSLAKILEVAPPKLPPLWASWLLGGLGLMLARSLRISNQKLRRASEWVPRYPSMREGWLAVAGKTGETVGNGAVRINNRS